MLGRMGIETGVDLDRAIDTARWIEQHVGHAVPGMLVKAGAFPGARTAAG
jgi:hydroxymethylglutaryl-CoA lyase